MTAAAQNVCNTKSLVYTKAPKMTSIKTTSKVDKASFKDMSSIKAMIAKAPAQGDIYGNYIEDNYNDLHECSPATLKESVVDGTTYVNIQMGDGYVDVVGTYDPATGKITVQPGQKCGTYEKNPSFGNFYFYGLAEGEKPGYVNIQVEDPITFTVGDDGTITLDQYGWCTWMGDLAEDQQGFWNLGLNTILLTPNAVQAGTCTISGAWTKYTSPIYVEDLEYNVNVYNFAEALGVGGFVISIDINDDGTVSMPSKQNLFGTKYNIPDAEIATYGDYFFVVRAYLNEDEKIYRDYKAENIAGTISGNTITLTDYWSIATNPDSDGIAYTVTTAQLGTTFTLNDGNYTAGIKEIGVTREEKIKNTKTYNIMGQQVNRANAKGLLIRNGKKFIK